jgi:hypothetical protein
METFMACTIESRICRLPNDMYAFDMQLCAERHA